MDHTTIKFRFNTKTGVLDIPAFDFSFLFSALEFYTTDGDKKDNAMYTTLFAEHMTAAFFFIYLTTTTTVQIIMTLCSSTVVAAE